MNSKNSKEQFSGSENYQTTTITSNLTPQSNLTESATVPHVNIPNVTSMQHASTNLHYGNPQPPQSFQLTSVNTAVNSSIVQNNWVVHPIAFFYRPPNDFHYYCIRCKEISVGTVIQSFNEFSGNSNNFNQNEYIFL